MCWNYQSGFADKLYKYINDLEGDELLGADTDDEEGDN